MSKVVKTRSTPRTKSTLQVYYGGGGRSCWHPIKRPNNDRSAATRPCVPQAQLCVKEHNHKNHTSGSSSSLKADNALYCTNSAPYFEASSTTQAQLEDGLRRIWTVTGAEPEGVEGESDEAAGRDGK